MIKGSYTDFKVVHKNDMLVKASYKEKFEDEPSGIILTIAPSVVLDRPTSGTIVSKGVDVELDLGIKVHFEKTSGYDLYFEDNKKEWFLLMDADSLLGYEPNITLS